MPADVHECPYFKSGSPDRAGSSVCFSTYQRELNELYMIASPMIKTIFGAHSMSSVEQAADNLYSTPVKTITEKLWNWRQRLPRHLVLDLDRESNLNMSSTQRIHRLQALALQLTFDNLIIILHRPFLAQQVNFLSRSYSGQDQARTPSSSHFSSPTYFSASHTDHRGSSQLNSQSPSPEQWWNAAVRTSRVTELPQLAQLATDSHLVAFLAINLFNSAIVMVVMALSDPLSDRAQEAKRTITRIFRLQELLGKRSMLSMQSSVVLRKVVHMLLHREAEAMLAPVTSLQPTSGDNRHEPSGASTPGLISVEDTLRLPLDMPADLVNHSPGGQEHINVDRVMRLNESLVSIQRALPIGSHGAQYLNGSSSGDAVQGQAVSQHAQQTGNEAWAYGNYGFNVATGESGEPSGDESSVDLSGNGLYWFWDTAWGEPHM
ncbi:hypothetical protein H2199_002001 [Coniosporium tulheliwenetii]|uniref:Uncharacterized protein n=1 Tax=Coniosporium tulheliwenetii TaxID=3383036 RepID=A0ACC2ZGS5_9PEZI|nr:hypothetical protein H2199_002001 [Cladosporium sp. JES 115]